MPQPRLEVTVDWDAAKADPVEFTRTFLRTPDGGRIEPHAAQIELLRGIKRNTVAVTGRQWGKSTSLGWYVSWFAMTHPHTFVWIMAPTLDQSRIIFNEVADYFRRSPLKQQVVGKIKNVPFPYLELKNGCKIQARGLNSPQYIRGNRAHLGIIDEASFVKEGSIRETVEPMFTVTGKQPDSALISISTPFGNGEFYDLWESYGKRADQGNPRFARFQFDSFSNPHADVEQLEEVRERYGADSPIWLAEYMGQFQDDNLAVFSSVDIKAAYEAWEAGLHFPISYKEGHRYVQGLDLANRDDYFVATMLDISDRDRNVLVAMDRYRRRGYGFYKARARSNYAAYGHAKTIIDATSMGESVEQDLYDINVIPYRFTGNAAKWEVVQELVRMFQERRIVIPFHKDIVAELSYFRYQVTPSKVYRMEAPRGKHDDIVMSLALCARLAAVPVTLGTFRGVDLSAGKPNKYTRDQLRNFNPLYDDDPAAA